jgi:hypothetical protein
VTALTWSALSFFLLVLVAGTAGLAVMALQGWRTLRALQRGVLAELSVLAGRGAALEARAAALGERGAELQESLARLNRSLVRARVLLLAVHDVRSAVLGIRAFLPRK